MDALRTVKIMRCFVQNMVDWACPDVVLFRAKLGWIRNQSRFSTMGKFRLTAISLQFGHNRWWHPECPMAGMCQKQPFTYTKFKDRYIQDSGCSAVFKFRD
jgi:hypothetical protein